LSPKARAGCGSWAWHRLASLLTGQTPCHASAEAIGPNPSERRSLRQAGQVAVRASETAVRARKNNDGPRGTGTAAAPRTSGAAARGMAPTPWRGCHRARRRAVLQIRRGPSPRFPLGSRRPKFRGLHTVALRLEVQGLVVHPEEPSCLALVPLRGVKCQADRLSLRLGGGAVGDLLQGGAHLFSSSVARSHGGADQPSQFADQ